MKRTERVSIIVKILSDIPGKVYPLQYFCDLFDMAKSSISEDINIANSAMEKAKKGNIETIAAAFQNRHSHYMEVYYAGSSSEMGQQPRF